MSKAPESVTIVGAGPTGLATAYFLSKANVPTTVVERSKDVGGMSGSFPYEHKGENYVLDYGPHKFYTQIDGVYDIYREVLGNKNILEVKKRNAIRIKGKDFDFPVKITQLATKLSPVVAAQIGLGVAKSLVTPKKEVRSFEDHFVRGFGQYGYGLIFRDYARKVWGDPKKLSEELARKRVPVSSAVELLLTMLKKPDKSVSADVFLYPKEGGYGHLSKAMETKFRASGGLMQFERELSSIQWEKKNGKNTVKSVNFLYQKQHTQEMPVDFLMSTIPINILPTLLMPKAPADVLKAAASLQFRSLRVFYLFLDTRPVMTDNWRFYPEEEYVFNRVSEMDSFSPHTVPKGKSVIMAEVTCGSSDTKAKMSDEELLKRIVKDLVKAQVLKKESDVKHHISRRATNVYPVYDLTFRKNLDMVLKYLSGFDNLITAGRAGLFNYNNADHCLDMGKRIAEWIAHDRSKSGWWNLLDYFDSYAIVD